MSSEPHKPSTDNGVPPFRAALRALVPYPPGKPIEEVQRELGLTQVVKLASNENPYGASPLGIQAFSNAGTDLHVYPEGGCHYLREALAGRLGVERPDLFFGNGSDEILALMTMALLEPGTSIVCSRYSFVRYRMGAEAMGAEVRLAEMTPGFVPQVDELLRLVDATTRLVFLGNPDNPTGTALPHGEVERLAAGLPRHALLVVDEAYFEFARDWAEYPQSLALRKRYPNIVVLRTFSKGYGLAGLRVGYGVGPAQLWDVVERVRPPFNVNRPAQAAAVAALDDEAHLARTVAGTVEGRELFYGLFRRLGMPYIESLANFVLADVGRAAGPVYDALLRKGVIVRPMGMYGLTNFLRVSVGLPEENRAFAMALEAVLAELPAPELPS